MSKIKFFLVIALLCITSGVTYSYDQVFDTVKLRYGKSYYFGDAFENTGDVTLKLKSFRVTFKEEGDFNNGANPTFSPTQEVRNDSIFSPGERKKILESSPAYGIKRHPVQRKRNNIEIIYQTTDQVYPNGKLTTHTEYQPYEITWCGDGVVDNYTDEYGAGEISEQCDPGDPTSWDPSKGESCNSTCEIITTPVETTCDGIDVKPTSGTAPLASNISCTGTNANSYKIEIQQAGSVLETISSNNGTYTFSNPGNYQVQCFVNDTVSSKVCKQAVTVDPPVPPVYDLALVKKVVGKHSGYKVGENVTFAITVTNQGESVANNFSITDYIPTGLELVSSGWTVSGNTVTKMISHTLNPRDSYTVNITFKIAANAPTTIKNYAEISEDDGDDCDSTPDDTNGNGSGESTGLVDDAIGTGCQPGGDEDDHDVEVITLEDPVYDLALVKKLSSLTPGPFKSGDTVTFDIFVTNQGTVDAQSITLTDYIPAGLTLSDSNWTQSGNMATRTMIEIDAGTTKRTSITFTITQTTAGSIKNYAEISTDDGNDCDSTPDSTNGNGSGESTGLVDNSIGLGCQSGGDEDDHDVEVIDIQESIYDLALTKTLSSLKDTFKPGEDVKFIITLTNQGNVPAVVKEVVDYIPTGLELQDSNWSEDNGIAYYNTDISLNPGEQKTVEINFRVAVNAPNTIRNYAEISEDDGDDCDSTPDDTNGNGSGESTGLVDDAIGTGCQPGGDEDDHDVEVITVDIPVYDLALVKKLSSSTPGPFKSGDTVMFNIVVTNQGNVDSGNITLTDYIPAGLTLSDSNWTQSGNIATRTLSNIAAGASRKVTITFTIDQNAPTTIKNYAEISEDDGDDCDSTPDNTNGNGSGESTGLVDDSIGTGCQPGGDEDDHDVEVITVDTPQDNYDLALRKTLVSTGTLSKGGNVTFEIEVFNQGTVDSGNITLTDYIPAGLTLSDTHWTQSGNMATRTLSNIAAGSSRKVTITFTIDQSAPTTMKNYAEISEDSGDDCDSTPDSMNGNTSGEKDGVLVDDAIGTGCQLGGDEDDHDVEVITVGDVTSACTNLSANPSSGVRTLTSNLVCTGNNATAYKIEIKNSAGNVVQTINTATGQVTLNTIGSYTASCYVNNETTTPNVCQKTLSVRSGGGGGGSPYSCESASQSGSIVTCTGNKRVKSTYLNCNGTILGPKNTTSINGKQSANFTCNAAVYQCFVYKNQVTNIGNYTWRTSHACRKTSGGGGGTKCGNGIVEPGEECDLGSQSDWGKCNKPGTPNQCKLRKGGGGGGGGGGTKTPGILTWPGGANTQFGPQGNIIIGHKQSALAKSTEGYPYIHNDSSEDIGFRYMCVKEVNDDASLKQRTSYGSNKEVCVELEGRTLFAYEYYYMIEEKVGSVWSAPKVVTQYILNDLIAANKARPPQFIGDKFGIGTRDYGQGKIVTTVANELPGVISGLNPYSYYFAGELDVRVAKPSISTVGGGTSFVKSTDSGDVAKVTDNKDTNFVGTSASADNKEAISSSVETVENTNTGVVDTIQGDKEMIDTSKDVIITDSIATATLEKYNGLENVFIYKGGDLKISSIPHTLDALSKPRTYIVEGGNLIIDQNVVANKNIAFVVRGGNIDIKKSVVRMDGTYITIRKNGSGGNFTAQESEKQLLVKGSLYGNVSNLVENRYYISDDTHGLSVGTIVSFGSSLFTKPAPLVTQFTKEYIRSTKVAK